ncbi:GntR family transcriptional regulator [Paenisporosarcina antarctica]|uniref:GntR family transcriptional regulator n=1 Tax=Paenisporosarcina antarctica TaxID=417367 RepID=A0A4P7A3L7_9BACL|nr:GntR family transcriptional regulator [Paenisporosarcina antarctica]QBP42626.1 GntR family transcriptional regulator [Paenisporosarcina antarctica]
MLTIDPKKKVKSFSTRDYVYEILKENIISLKIKPGQNISEKEISEMLEVSRTPVREAFVKLAQEELVEVYPQRGTVVSLIDLFHVEEARFIREHLERATVRVACEKFTDASLVVLETNLIMQKQCVQENNFEKLFELDEAFHHTISIGCGKERISLLIQQMNAHINRIRMLSLAANYNWDLILEQHEQIFNAIKEKKPDVADKVMEEHLKKLRFDQENLKIEYSQYFK